MPSCSVYLTNKNKQFQMKKIIITTFLVGNIISANAQDKVEGAFYGAVTTSFWNHFSINQTLSNNDLKTINLIMPSAGLGMSLKYKDFRAAIGFNFMTGIGKTGQSSYKFHSIPLDFNLEYKVLKLNGINFYAGLTTDFIPTSLELYSDEGVIDIKDISPDTQSGLIMLYNSLFLLGPSMNIALFPESNFPASITVSYEFNINHGVWKSEYATLVNAPHENGNRFLIKLIFPFATYDN